jgi:hypothetical protein
VKSFSEFSEGYISFVDPDKDATVIASRGKPREEYQARFLANEANFVDFAKKVKANHFVYRLSNTMERHANVSVDAKGKNGIGIDFTHYADSGNQNNGPQFRINLPRDKSFSPEMIEKANEFAKMASSHPKVNNDGTVILIRGEHPGLWKKNHFKVAVDIFKYFSSVTL